MRSGAVFGQMLSALRGTIFQRFFQAFQITPGMRFLGWLAQQIGRWQADQRGHGAGRERVIKPMTP